MKARTAVLDLSEDGCPDSPLDLKVQGSTEEPGTHFEALGQFKTK
jgi:hypothetical protein